ncbi:uncharacterized protein [Bos indicus]|uniref:Uncharacterized protein n=1 Tax=Bos indicus TaxID=9915 RepID=A0ABM4R4S3_BOSIN
MATRWPPGWVCSEEAAAATASALNLHAAGPPPTQNTAEQDCCCPRCLQGPRRQGFGVETQAGAFQRLSGSHHGAQSLGQQHSPSHRPLVQNCPHLRSWPALVPWFCFFAVTGVTRWEGAPCDQSTKTRGGGGGVGVFPAGALWPQHSTTRCLWPGPHPAPSTVRCFQGSLRADSSPGVAPVLWGRVALPRDFTRCSPAVHAGPARHPASKNDPFCCSALSRAVFLSLPLRSGGSFDLDSWAHCSSKPPPRLVATALPRGALNWPLWGPQASGNPHTGVKWSLQGHTGHEGPSAGGPWAPLRHPPLREKGGGVLQVGVWGHHTDPALECSSEQEGGPGGVSAHPVCSAPPVPVCAGSSVTVAFKDEQAVGLRSLLAWVVLTQPGGELWPNQGRACTPLVAVSEGHLPVTSRGRRK